MDGYVNISVYELGWPIHVRASSISHPLFSSVSLRFGVVGWTYVVLYVIYHLLSSTYPFFTLLPYYLLSVPTTDRSFRTPQSPEPIRSPQEALILMGYTHQQ